MLGRDVIRIVVWDAHFMCVKDGSGCWPYLKLDANCLFHFVASGGDVAKPALTGVLKSSKKDLHKAVIFLLCLRSYEII